MRVYFEVALNQQIKSGVHEVGPSPLFVEMENKPHMRVYFFVRVSGQYVIYCLPCLR